MAIKEFRWKGRSFRDPHSDPSLSEEKIEQIHLSNIVKFFGTALETASPQRISKISAKLKRKYVTKVSSGKILMA